jgi:NTP pyrophosphatase (non-canonical NTP hydrolase)
VQLNDYQEYANKTAIYKPELAILYPTLGLAGEAGELANKVKKIFRDYGGNLNASGLRGQLIDELGDVLWYVAAVAADIEVTLEEVAVRNVKKLAARKDAGTLHGSGDNR